MVCLYTIQLHSVIQQHPRSYKILYTTNKVLKQTAGFKGCLIGSTFMSILFISTSLAFLQRAIEIKQGLFCINNLNGVLGKGGLCVIMLFTHVYGIQLRQVLQELSVNSIEIAFPHCLYICNSKPSYMFAVRLCLIGSTSDKTDDHIFVFTSKTLVPLVYYCTILYNNNHLVLGCLFYT